MDISLYDKEGRKTSALELKDDLFSSVNEALFYEVVKMQRANRRAGTASTRTRADVSGGGIKPWKQKGTGRARSGSTRSPLWRHGGTAFGPHPRDYSYSIPKKAVKGALKSAFALKARDGRLKVFESLDLGEPKTRGLLKILKNVDSTSALIVDSPENGNLLLSARNLKDVKFLPVGAINIYDLLRYDDLLITRSSFDAVISRFV
ncbi:MAG: 50S ribosomal protein L4 [Deltaproteobacteria bacterium]|nr:50S ribosomal protein L4 [Deltaproteobacteria bacterium]